MYEGENIKKIRKRKNMTGKRLAELAGYAPSFISEIEHNKTTPTISTLENIAQALDVMPSVILDEKFYYPYLSVDGLKAMDSNVSYDKETFSTLHDLWLDVVGKWEIQDVEELIVYLQTKNVFIEKRANKE